MYTERFDTVRAIVWEDGALKLLDQRRLPQVTEYIACKDVDDVAAAIRDMVVRGAPAIGVTAAYGVVLAAQARYRNAPGSWRQDIVTDLEMLVAARPTAVNLSWAIERMQRIFETIDADPNPLLLAEARKIHKEDIAANKAMGELGKSLFAERCAVLTHCNTGSLATAGYGTALGVIRSAYAADLISQVYADETRPWLQGSRLTAWELVQDHIPVTLIAEGADAYLMKQGEVKWVIVGADRIAANGDVANKIGTYNAAVLARYHGVKFMVVAPTSTIDMNTPDGTAIRIEMRAEDELLKFSDQRIAAPGAHAWNPVFDVTPAELIDVIVTEKGIVTSPTLAKMHALLEQ
jgi:methylthioribose-1-phosphate isomerase